jgi:hypothetical protein
MKVTGTGGIIVPGKGNQGVDMGGGVIIGREQKQIFRVNKKGCVQKIHSPFK